MNKFEQRLAEIRKSEGAIGQWQESIKHKREAFEANLQYDKDCLAVCQGYLNALFEGNVCVRAGDLIEELAKELGVDKNDLQWQVWSDIHFWGKNSRKEMVDIMKKRGYSLVYESPNKLTMGFAVLNTKTPQMTWSVTVLADKNAFVFNTAINPGVIKLSTDFFTGVDDDELFNSIEQYMKDVLTKLNS